MSIPTELARSIRMVIIDVDGVMTDGGIMVGAQGAHEIELKRFEITDGLGVKMLQWAGLIVYVISGRRSESNRLRALELEVEYREAHGGYKLVAADRVRQEHGLEWAQVCCIGDDLPDLPMMRLAGLPIAVANATKEVGTTAKWQTTRKGGDGAVREAAEALLQARGEWDELVETYCRQRSAAPPEA
jgi:3-deoxy-D-manno-octulosonate 8-phosphate phosphatase (KDO 8-P phosphatase)